MTPRCTAEPISWLRLERYHLGELRGAERQAIADHLAACEACAACLARIEQDDAVALPVLPPLPAPRRGVLLRWP
ncbi:MAG: zf-HC2 domain-containing protein, partial [Polyangiaceae bacterium]